MNRILGHERCITGPEPGLTRDAISTTVNFEGGTVEIIDTAGWIKKSQLKAHDDSEGAVAELTMREGKTVLRFVHIVLLLIDCTRCVNLVCIYGTDGYPQNVETSIDVGFLEEIPD